MKKKEKIESLEKMIVMAYRNQCHPEMSSDWRLGVMLEIGQIRRRAEQVKRSLFEWLFPTQILYKFAGVSCTCALALIFFFLISGESINHEFSSFFLNDPLGITSLMLFVP